MGCLRLNAVPQARWGRLNPRHRCSCPRACSRTCTGPMTAHSRGGYAACAHEVTAGLAVAVGVAGRFQRYRQVRGPIISSLASATPPLYVYRLGCLAYAVNLGFYGMPGAPLQCCCKTWLAQLLPLCRSRTPDSTAPASPTVAGQDGGMRRWRLALHHFDCFS